MHNSRHKNKSTDNKYSDHQLSHYERKCITPSLLTHQNKKSIGLIISRNQQIKIKF